MAKQEFRMELWNPSFDERKSIWMVHVFLIEQWPRAPGWLHYIRDYTTQFYRDYNKPIYKVPYQQISIAGCSWRSNSFFRWCRVVHVRGFPSQFVLQSKSTTFGAFVQRPSGILISCVIKFTCWSHQTALTKFNFMQSSQQKFATDAMCFCICPYCFYTFCCIFLKSYPLTSPPVAQNRPKTCFFQSIHLGKPPAKGEFFLFCSVEIQAKWSKMTILLWYVRIITKPTHGFVGCFSRFSAPESSNLGRPIRAWLRPSRPREGVYVGKKKQVMDGGDEVVLFNQHVTCVSF